MADPRTNLLVKISADNAEMKSALLGLRGELQKVKKEAAGIDLKGLAGGLRNVLGLVGGFSAITLGIRAIANATIEAEKAQAQLNAVIKSTGGAAGVTAKEANKLADSLQAISTYDDEAIIGAETLLLRFKNIGQEVFPQATKAVLNMSAALGTDLESSVTKIGKALQDPINGMGALQKAGVKLTEGQKELIKDLTETGRIAEAQAIILKELERAYGGSAEAARNTLGGALEGLKNDFENVLEGDSGSDGMRGMVDAIKDLSAVMRDPSTKQGFQIIVEGLADIASAAINAISVLSNLSDKIGGFGAYATASGGLTGLIGASPSIVAALLKPADKKVSSGITRRGGAAQGATKKGPSQVYVDQAADAAANAAKQAAEDAKKTTAAAVKASKSVYDSAARDRVAAEKKAAEEIAEINEQETQDIEDRNQRIAEGMADVRIELLRQTGQTAEAAFAEIDAKYSKLLADLKAKGDSEGEAALSKLIGIEKAEAQLNAFDEKVRAIMDNLREQTAYINNQIGVPGGITSTDAEVQLRTLREQSIAQLIVLRDTAQEAYNVAPSAEALQRLNDLNGSIKQIDQSFNTLLQKTAEDSAVQALSGFFNDLATGAKSFKDAFKDMVRSFISGIAQMISQQLALNAVKAISKAVGGFHSGGIAGGAPTFRRSIDPAIFSAAPRYHTGGIAGLRANEVPAILLKGERVLSPSQTAAYDKGSRPSPGTRIVNIFDPAFVPDQMDSAAGEKVILNVIGKNPQRIKQILA